MSLFPVSLIGSLPLRYLIAFTYLLTNETDMAMGAKSQKILRERVKYRKRFAPEIRLLSQVWSNYFKSSQFMSAVILESMSKASLLLIDVQVRNAGHLH